MLRFFLLFLLYPFFLFAYVKDLNFNNGSNEVYEDAASLTGDVREIQFGKPSR